MEITKQLAMKEVQLAIESIEEARSISDLKKEERLILESSLIKLSNIEQSIIRKIGNDLVSKLTTDAEGLNELVVQIDKTTMTCTTAVNKIVKATELVNSFIKTLTVRAKLG